jgi:hypothetical protein
MLKFVSEYLSVAVNNELAFDEVEQDTALRPFLILGFMARCRPTRLEGSVPCSFPQIVVPARPGQTVSVFLSVGRSKTVSIEGCETQSR